MPTEKTQQSYGTDDLKQWLAPIRSRFKPRALILLDHEYADGWNVVFVVDWEERIVRVTTRFGVQLSQREFEDRLEQTFLATASVPNYQFLLVESDPGRRGYKKRLLDSCQQEMLKAGLAAQALLDSAPGEGEVEEALKQAVREIMIHPSNREGVWQGMYAKPQSSAQLTWS